MPLVVTQALVLHAFDYLESSRVIRLITREAGVQSVIAKGARRTRGRVGSGVDLFAEGEAQLYIKPARDLHTLASFDVTSSRAGLALDLPRFTAASALAELTLRVAGDESSATMFDILSSTLDALVDAPPDAVVGRALAGAWKIVAEAGFTPALEVCAACHGDLDPAVSVAFSHPAGGSLCEPCARLAAVSRRVPPDARALLRGWLAGNGGTGDDAALSPLDARAHQRLLREFVREHIPGDDRAMRAYTAWETEFGTVAVRSA